MRQHISSYRIPYVLLVFVLGVFVFARLNASSINNGGGGGGGGTGNAAANVTTTFSTTPTYTCPSATAGTVVNFALSTVLTANITSSTLAGCTPGSMLNFLFQQDGTGGRTVTMPLNFDPAAINPSNAFRTKCTYFLDGSGAGRLTGGGCVSDSPYGWAVMQPASPNPPTSSCYSWFDTVTVNPHWNCNSLVFTAVFPQSRPPNQFVTGILATGAITTAAIAAADLPAALTNTNSVNGTSIPASQTLATVIATNITAMPTAAVAANACSPSATTSPAVGALTADAAEVTFATDPTGVVGYGGGTNGGITIVPWVTTNQMNFKLCNQTGSSITPGAISINWRIIR